jgi:dimethylsulfone monooxygenase
MTIRLGLFYPNAQSIHVCAPKVIAANPDLTDYDVHTKLAQTAENIGFDYAFMADGWGSFGPKALASGYYDPIILSPMLAVHLLAVTRRLRCITTIHTSFFHPLLIARMGGALDALSKGRWGINIVTGSGFGEGLDKQTFGSLNSEQRYERASETMDILLRAWRGTKIEFDGKYFQIDGQLVGPNASLDPKPLIVSAGASDAGREFAGRYADYIFMPGRTPRDELNKRFADIKQIAARHGRPDNAVQLQVHASVVVRKTASEAKQYSEWISESVDLELVAEYLNGVRGGISTYDDVYRSLGDLQMRQVGSVAGARKIHGSADEVADHIEMLYRDFGCNGIAVSFPVWTLEEVNLFGELVLPRLRAKGIWAEPAEHGWSW